MSETIYTVATLVWSVVVLGLLVVFRRPLGRLIRAAGNRDLAVTIAGHDLSVADISRQHADLITDLQRQVSALQHRIAELEHGRVAVAAPVEEPGPRFELPAPVAYPAEPVRRAAPAKVLLPAGPPPWERTEVLAEVQQAPPPPRTPQPRQATPEPPPAPVRRPSATGVLWVDDHPERNAVQLDVLQRGGLTVHTAPSTESALECLRGHRYQIVVSGMLREENGRTVPNAGLELIRAIRALDQDTPIAIYSSAATAGMYGPMAQDAGANLLTASWFELSEELRRRELF